MQKSEIYGISCRKDEQKFVDVVVISVAHIFILEIRAEAGTDNGLFVSFFLRH